YPIDGKFIVNRTRDGGNSFDPLTRGLPSPPAYDLVYRHALEVDSTGNVLVMGSTTGGLWISENGGDSWTEISSHLPPVYVVRFG
ncbi:MAG: exo-alpha-sialidase, partial [Verrucomicrobiales bacterium]|nr:exo-alpha-sialidase [Verrucomicrobiales bacterium]